MEPIVPVISPSAAGPLGICHLPRVWLKCLLHATGRLPDGFRHGAGGHDGRLFEALGIDPDAFVAFVEAELPTYVECERWVRRHAQRLDPETFERYRQVTLGWLKPAEEAKGQRTWLGLDDDVERNTVLLNDLDDWQNLHALVTTGAIPAPISTSLHGISTNLLADLRAETRTDRTAIYLDLPQFGKRLEVAFVEVKARGAVADETRALFAIEELRRGEPLVRTEGTVAAPIVLGGKLAGAIVVQAAPDRTWTDADDAAIRRAVDIATARLETVVRGGL